MGTLGGEPYNSEGEIWKTWPDFLKRLIESSRVHNSGCGRRFRSMGLRMATGPCVRLGCAGFSYSSYADVWDYLKKPMRAFLNQIGEKDGQVIDKSVTKGLYEAAQEFASPFFTQNLAIEPLVDVLPEELLGRGGKNTEGYSVYSQTDKWPTKLGKSLTNIIRNGMPGAISQAKKYGDIAYDIYTERGDPDAAWQKFVSSITGRKIQKFDLLKIMKQKAGKLAPTI